MAPVDSISRLSNQELKEKLKDYGINIGPIVSSTRSLYEKKLRKIELGQELLPKYTEVPFDDESDDFACDEDEIDDDEDIEDIPPLIMEEKAPRRRPGVPGSPARITRQTEPMGLDPSKDTARSTISRPAVKSVKKEGSDSFPKWLILLVIIILLALGYFIVSNMESNTESNIPTQIEAEV